MAYRNAVHALIRKAHQHLTKDRMGQPEMFSYINQGWFYVGGYYERWLLRTVSSSSIKPPFTPSKYVNDALGFVYF